MTKSVEREPKPDFLFKDDYGEYKISEDLKQLCDDKFNDNNWILVYLARLAHVASGQQAEYKGDAEVSHYGLDGGDPVEGSALLESVSRSYEGREGMTNFIEARDELIRIHGNDVVLQLESILKVDSAGVEAGDERPLLGLDKKMVASLSHYLQKAPGYQEIK